MTGADTLFPATPPSEATIDEDAVAAYALATNDPNPRYLDGRAVPPLFTATMILRSEWEAQRLGVGAYDVTGARGSVHGQHDVYYRAPLRPGMALRWTAATHSAHQTKSGVIVVQRIVITDLDGRALVEHLWSSFHIGGTINAAVGPEPPNHIFPEAARDHPAGRKAVIVDRDQAFRYAGVSGDHAGHAISDDIAQFEGYPRKILQGMCTFGLAAGAVVDMVADGDPDRLRRLAVRFSAPAFPRKDLDIGVFDGGLTEDGHQSFAFEADQDGVKVLKHGRVQLTD